MVSNILCNPCLVFQHPYMLNKVQYLADGDVGKAIWLQEIVT
jgi:hypothetical protein